jgi:hypothetical protein
MTQASRLPSPPKEYGAAESPFLDHELFLPTPAEEWESRAAALVADSPFAGALEDAGETFELNGQNEPETSSDEADLEATTGEAEAEPAELWEELEGDDRAPHSHEEEEEEFIDTSTAAEAPGQLEAATLDEQEADSPTVDGGQERFTDEAAWLGPEVQHQVPPARARPLRLMFRSTALPAYADQNGERQPTDCAGRPRRPLESGDVDQCGRRVVGRASERLCGRGAR